MSLSAFPYIGSKTYLAPWITDHLRDHDTFIVPMGGAAGVLLNKPRSACEIFNDRDDYVVEFFRTVRDNADVLAERVESIPYSRSLYNEWSDLFRSDTETLADDRITRVARWVFLRYASFSGRYGSRAGFATDTPRGGPQKSEIWARVPERIETLRDRFAGVAIEGSDYAELVDRYDERGVLWYFDPPYTEADGGYYRGPSFDHSRLIDTLEELTGSWVVSYSEPPAGLEEISESIVERNYNRTAGLNNDTRAERLYCSYDPSTVPLWIDDRHQARLGETDAVAADGGQTDD